MLALNAIDTTEITSLATFRGAIAADILDRNKVSFNVDKQPIYLSSGQVFPGKFATVRTDVNRALGIVGNRYHVLQNATSLNLFDVAARAGIVEYGAAGTFDGGAIVWIQAKIPGDMIVGPDRIEKRLTLATSHDGSSTTRLLVAGTRIVCRNTYEAARREAGGWTLRHTRSAGERIKLATNAIERAVASFAEMEQASNHLWHKRMSYSETKAAIDAIFPATGEDVSTRLDNVRGKVVDLVETGRGNYAVRGTAWGVFNAVTEYVDHHRATRGEESNRLQSAWLGSGAAIKRKAFDVLAA